MFGILLGLVETCGDLTLGAVGRYLNPPLSASATNHREGVSLPGPQSHINTNACQNYTKEPTFGKHSKHDFISMILILWQKQFFCRDPDRNLIGILASYHSV